MRRVRRKIGNKDKVFGCDLLEHLTASSQEIPQVLQCCSEFLEKHGIVDGIYRLSGVSSNIQKLRGEFESDGSPDLHKELYMQDIHCVSSLCKAYFRELPNPLLTYQLYDKFAEAVAIQLEEERLVKIRDVLKELPPPHHRTLEFLMRHLVRMASYCSETNMHCRNLAIVWAPNLLRSKDIETSGFNGTAAFMEVRVQSIVVEFILTHVPQLFPEGGSDERRKSLPSPSLMPNQEEGFFKAAPIPFPHFGNISPGDGPLAMRPYHAIIEGTDKRKGSLKGRKWMSIFNIGGRFPDPRRRHKHSSKEKDRPALRPARSMDSLSSSPFPNEGSRRAAQCPPDTNLSALVTPSPQSGSEVPASTGALGGSEYAVTYRRGTGLVSGGTGTQGTYTCLDPEGLGLTDNETLQSRSPGLSSKGRRAAMHITGPTMVTVPLHITSNLALGVLQGGGGARVIHRGRDREGGDKVVGKEGGEKAWRRESRGMERKVEDTRKVEEEEKIQRGKVTDGEGVTDAEGSAVAGGGGEKEGEGKKEQEEGGGDECSWKLELVVEGQSVSREQRAKSRTSNTEGDKDVDDNKDADEYMDMEGVKLVDCQPEATERGDDCVFDAPDVLNSTEVEEDQELSGYVQDNFEFLDHMDCSVPHQMNEFSVEPPGHSDDEYEVMEQANLQPDTDTQTRSPTELNPHRPLSIDSQNRHTKSLSLPYMTSPVFGSDESCSEEEAVVEDSDDDNESMFTQSLPSSSFFGNFLFETDTDKQDSCTSDGVPVHQSRSYEDGERRSLNDFSACGESTAGDQEQVEVEDKGDEDGLREKEVTKKEEEDHQGRDQLENNRQSKASEEDDSRSDEELPLPPEAPTHCWADFPPPSDDESNAWADLNDEEEEEEEEKEKEKEEDMLDNHPSDYPPCQEVPCATRDIFYEGFGDFSFGATEQPRKERGRDEGEDSEVNKELEDACQEMVLEIKESDDNMWEESPEEGNEVIAEEKHGEKMQGGDKEQDGAICRTGGDTCVELEDAMCEVTEVEESEQVEKMDASDAEEGDTIKDVGVGEEEVPAEKVSGEETLEVDEGEGNEVEVTVEVEEESTESTEDKFTDPEMQREFEETEANLPKTSELEDPSQGKEAVNDEAQRPDREEAASKEKEKDNGGKESADEQRRIQPSLDEQLKEVRCDGREWNEGRKSEESDSSQGGVGRKLVISKHPRVYQAKAVPVVPPKPQHCKITALTLRHQQQQRENRDADGGGENAARVPTEHDAARVGDAEDEGKGRKERPTLRGGERAERERERRRDGEDNATRDTSRNSPLSMCFDEAVAKATMRREKEKECEKEKERERDWGNEGQ